MNPFKVGQFTVKEGEMEEDEFEVKEQFTLMLKESQRRGRKTCVGSVGRTASSKYEEQ